MINLWRAFIRRAPRGVIEIPPKRGRANGRTVVLVHGVLYYSGAMRLTLGEFLADHGYRVLVYDYHSSRSDIAGHAAELADFLAGIDEPFALVTHSMGGLMARLALNLKPCRAASLLMITPPNYGSRRADFWMKAVPGGGRMVKSLGDLRYGSAGKAADLPPVPSGIPTGILAAAEDAQVEIISAMGVPPSSVASDGYEFAVARGSHISVMRGRDGRRKILRFLKSGKFFLS